MKNNKKGFTLIELLAVIVILAIIMVIAVPQILNVIENSKRKAFESSYKLIGDAIKSQVVSSTLTEGNKFTKDGECYIFELPDKNENASNLNVKNKEQFTGTIKYCNGKLEYENVTNGSYIVNTEGGKDKISKVDGEEDDNKDDEVDTANYLINSASSGSTTAYLEGPIKKNEIESIKFETSKNVPSDAIGNWDVSNEGNGSVMAWYKDEDNDSLYELYIGQNGGVRANPNSSYLFSYLTNVTSIDFSNFNTLNVTDMQSMFYSCSSLTSLDLSNFNTSNVIYMANMFNACTSLTSLKLSSFDTSNVIYMSNMFGNCTSLTNLDLSNFDTSNVTTMESMFYRCSSLTSLNLSSFNTSNVTNMTYMFGSTPKLSTSITISKSSMTDSGYSNMFYNAATDPSAKIIINYISGMSGRVDRMIATKSSNSNVVKGELVE